MPMMRPCVCCRNETGLIQLFRKNGHQIVRCSVCGLHYVDRIPSAGDLKSLYGSEFFDVGRKFALDDTSPGMVNARARVDLVGNLPHVHYGHWLDVGCATGDFLKSCKDMVGTVRGVDLSTEATEQASDRGFNVHAGDFLDVPFEEELFDVVSMWDYIEHVPDPDRNFRKAMKLLSPGGYLILSTGNVESRVAATMGRYWHLMIPPRHLYFFSPTTITRLLEAAGFISIVITSPGKHVPLDFIVWKLMWMLSPRLAPSALAIGKAFRLGYLVPRINLHDIMTVSAQKPTN